MFVSGLVFLLGLALRTSAASLSQRTSNIDCAASSIKNGSVWYRETNSNSTPNGQIGVLEAYGNAELLAKYPNNNVQELTVMVVPCNSTYLNVTTTDNDDSSSASSPSLPVKLLLSSDQSQCIGLQGDLSSNVFVTKQDCSMTDDDTQSLQFWDQDDKSGNLLPMGGPAPTMPWNLQFNQYDDEEVIANPPHCFSDQTCQTNQEYTFVIMST